MPRPRHPIPAENWPTSEQASASKLFSPLTLGSGLRLRERTWIPAMVPWRASEDGHVTPAVLAWYERFAEGCPGVIVVEATGIRDVSSGPLLRIGHDRFVPGLRQLVETVRRASGGATRLFIQVIDFLAIKRRPDRERYLRQFLALRDPHRAAVSRSRPGLDECDDDSVRDALVACTDDELRALLSEREWEDLSMGYRERVTDLHLPHVAQLPEVLPGLFSNAAARAREAGFDGVELHYAHAYTMASLLSTRNCRSDGYGGSPEGRMRLPLQVLAAVRERVGHRYTVGIRMLCDEAIQGGSDLSDTVTHARGFAAAGVDYLSLSRGGKFEDARQPAVGAAAYPYTGPSGHACMPTVFDAEPPFGLNLPFAAMIRRGIRGDGRETPIVAAGGINGFRLAEQALNDGHADLIAAARQSLADPDWWAKVRAGRGDHVQRCLYTNYCEALDQQHRQVTCQLWDRLEQREGDDAGVPMSSDGHRRLVAPRGRWIARQRPS